MMKFSFWLSALFLISTFVIGSAAAGSGVQYTPVADDNYVMMCDDAGQIADAGYVLAQVRTDRDSNTQTIAPKRPATTNQMKAPGPTTQQIAEGDCCGPVLGGCVSWCNKSGGCTGKGDCDTFKAN